MSILSSSSLLASNVFQIVDGLIGGLSGAAGAKAGGLAAAGSLDGRFDLSLLDTRLVSNLSLFGADGDGDGDGLADLRLLDKDGDGLIDIGLLKTGLGVSLLDTAGNGLVDATLLDAVKLGASAGLGAVGGLLGAGADPAAYRVVLDASVPGLKLGLDGQAAFVRGEAGLDTVTYEGDSDGVRVQADANGVFVGAGTKVDYLQGVERIAFADGTLALDTGAGEIAGTAFRLYQAAFDRLPDMDGLTYWIGQLDAGRAVASVAEGFLQSPEFQATYGAALSNLDFVETLYGNILGRAGEAAGLAYWTDRLDGGAAARADVLVGFSESAENVALVGATIDAGLFLV